MAKQWWARAVLGRTAVSDPFQEPDHTDPRFELEWRSVFKTRVVVILVMLGVWVAGLEAQLVYLQVFSHQAYLLRAERQQQDIMPAEAPRGDVRDRNGQLLAYSVESFDVKANPSFVKDPPREAKELCDALDDCSAEELVKITATFTNKKTKDVVIRAARDLSPDAATRVHDLIAGRVKALKGAPPVVVAALPVPASIWLVHRSVRYYPKMSVAAHVVGFVKGDGRGGGGVESRYDSKISGVPGRVLAQVDGKTNEMSKRVERAPVPGASVELTIDTRLQQIAERELQGGVIAAGAGSGSAMIMDPNTGEILAQASYPTFNPNDITDKESDDTRRNRAVQDLYEPGSTFKIVTASAALNENVFTTDRLIDTNPGRLSLPGRKTPIHEDQGHNYGVVTFENVIVRSSNVGAAKIGLEVGADRMIQYARRFGFGQQIAPDFAGENAGLMTKPGRLNESALASMSMGYQVGVTPTQMATAASVVANGGQLVEPHIVRAFIRDGHREEIAPKVVRRVISPDTALTMTTIMEGVVASPIGTGKLAQLSRYQVAGKTGTAQKSEHGVYSDSDYYVSFVGFVPSRKPVFTILVVVDSPTIGLKYGGKVAAPIFRRIAEAALEYEGVAPTVNPTPAIIVATDRSRPQLPAAPVETPALTKVGGRPVMPDLRGLTLRDANRLATALGLVMTMDGDGVVVSQTPAPGEFLDESGRGTLQARRGPSKSNGGDR